MKKTLQLIAFIGAAIFVSVSNAQVLQITDFVMFAGNGGPGTTNPGPSGYGVIMGSSSTITGGSVGSYEKVQTTGGTSFYSNIYSGGTVDLTNGNTVTGRITAANSAGASGTILSVGSNSVLSGNIDINGNIVVQGGTVSGIVTHPLGTTYSGPAIGANDHVGTPSLPTLPALPPVTVFPPAGATNITTTTTITPGSYGNVSLGNNKTLTLNGPGTYVFNSFNQSSNSNLKYNFQNQANGVFRIYVHGDAILGKLQVTFQNGGSATRIYWEIHGTGATSSSGKDALEISNGSNGGSGSVKFSGTVWATKAAILLGSGTGSSQYEGTLYSATQIYIQTGVNMTYSYFTDCATIVANAGADVNFCPSGSASLGAAPSPASTYSWSPATGLSNAAIANPTVTLSAPGTTTYTVTRTENGCSSTDQANVTVYSLPVVSAGSYAAVCVNGSSVTLAGTPSGGTFSGTGVSGNSFNPSVAGVGTKTLTYTYTDAHGCTNSATTNITVNALPTVSAGTYAAVCVNGSSVSLAGTPAGGTFSGSGVSGNTFSPATAGVGTKTITYTYTDGNGCTNSATASIVVNALPVVSAGSYSAVCVNGTTVSLAGTPAGGTFSGSGVSGNSFNPATAGVGTKTITYTYTDGNGCTNSATTNIVVNALTPVNAGTYSQLCIDATPITLSGTPSGGTFSGTGVSGNSFDPTAAGIGTHTVTYTYTDANSCTNSATTDIDVTALPTVSAGSYSALCIDGADITLSGTPAGGSFSGTGVSGSTFSPAVAGAGTQTITYTYTNGLCSNSATTDIVVNNLPNISAGNADSMDCFTPTVQLAGSSTTPGAQFSWVASHGGEIVGAANIANPTIDAHGIFNLTVTDPATGCTATDADTVGFKNCIFSGISEDGKSDEIIGIDLTSLYLHYDYNTHENPNPDLFLISNDRVWVEIVYNEGMYATLLPYLTAAPFNLNPALFVDNGTGNRIITTEIDIAQLWNLNNLNITTGIDMINHVRPVYPAVPTAGPAYSFGDVAQKSDLARNGFGVDGQGIKIGVISDSYNTKPGNYANVLDVPTGELPGAGNPEGDVTPVDVIQEYPYGVRTDEGRAMLQIVHDIAPGAELAFASGFISQGNMAQQIRNLKLAGCDAVVDDITYPTSPFFIDGMVSRAIRDVTAQGMTYITSAGNFGMKSCEGTFNGTTVPPGNGLSGEAHNFGGGDVYQSITLDSGSYLAVLQWEDDFYSFDSVANGAISDLDWYLTYNNGITLFGMNRDNNGTVQNPIGGDPFEVMSFYVNIPAGTHVNSNILIIRDSADVYPASTRFKYVFFKCPSAAPVINEYSGGISTIVGHANCDSAITVGAVRYSNTPAYGITPTIASFSSVGGTTNYGTPVHKPDLCAPNGVNTTVDFGSPNEDPPFYIPPAHDAFPNFYGTSASAPHVAGITALMMQAKMKYYGEDLTPYQVKHILTQSAYDMYPSTLPGFDYLSGYGLADADSALRTFAAPTADLISLDNTPTGYSLGDTVPAFNLIATADYITTQSQIVFRDDTLPTTWIDSHHLSANVPSFFGNPPFWIWTPPITPLANDGGNSDTLYFFNYIKKEVVIQADNKSKKYGEKLPVFTSTVTVDGLSLADAGLTLEDLGLENIQYSTLPANINYLSITGNYVINPEPSGPFDVGLLELYNYTFNNSFQEPPQNGVLTIEKMPLLITPIDKTYLFGDKIDGRDFDYALDYDSTNIDLGDRGPFYDSLNTLYKSGIVKEVVLVDDRDEYDNSTLTQTDIINLAFLSGSRATANGSRATANGSRATANNLPYPDTTYTVDLSYESLVQYLSGNGDSASLTNSVLLLNGSRGTVNGSRGTVNSEAVVNGTAVINGSHAVANGSRATANGSRGTVNGEELDGVSNTNTAIIIHETDLDVEENPDSGFEMISINGITGMTAGDHWIIPAGFLSANFSVTYHPGHMHIDPYEIVVDAQDKSTEYGTAPAYSAVISGYQYDDTAAAVFAGSLGFTPDGSSQINVGNHTITPGGLTLAQPTNYYLTFLNGNLNVTPATLTATADDKSRAYGFDNPPLTISYSGFKFSDNESVINPVISSSTTAVPSSAPGTYPISLSGGVAANYNIVRVPGVLTVEAAPSCSINSPASAPIGGSTGNNLTATAPAGYTYSWGVSGTGWQITGGGSTLSATYTAGAFGTSGVFTLSVYAPGTGVLVSTCSITLDTQGPEYCAYDQNFWGNVTATDCNGIQSQSIVPGLLTTSLVNGDGSRQVVIATDGGPCMQSRLPSGNSNTQLPNGIVTCQNATGNTYLNNGKFRSNLLGRELALALSVRLSPGLGDLHITGPYITTWAASSCANGSMVPGTRTVYSLPSAVVNYLGTNNTVNDLIALANRGLGSTLPGGAPSLNNIASACETMVAAFDHCRIFAGFSQTSAGARIRSTDDNYFGNNLQVFPNPTSDKANVSFVAAKGSKALLEVYGINGTLTTKVLDGTLSEDGIYSIAVDCSSFVKGIYFVRLTVDEESSVAKLVIIK